MADFPNIGGTTETKFQVGKGNALLKGISATQLAARNASDSAYAEVQALLQTIFGTDIVLNAAATESGGSWKTTLRVPSTGMTTDVVLIMPANGAPTVGMALTVASVAAGVITLQYATVPSGTDMPHIDTTALPFGSTSPVAMFNNPVGGEVQVVRVIIDTPFTGGTGPSLSIGISGTTSKYMPATAVDLTAAAGSIFSYRTGAAPAGSAESVIATYAANSATAGAARIETTWVIPS